MWTYFVAMAMIQRMIEAVVVAPADMTSRQRRSSRSTFASDRSLTYRARCSAAALSSWADHSGMARVSGLAQRRCCSAAG